jgi:hypothetical protein
VSTATLTDHSPTFAESIRALSGHPAVNEMAADLLKATPQMLATLTDDDGGPTSAFMIVARDRFAERAGGECGPYLGTVARAVLARLAELRAAELSGQLAAMPGEVSEAYAAELEARQAIRDMWNHGFPRCPLTRYADAAGRLADRLADPDNTTA